jgi:hypothetical protein
VGERAGAKEPGSITTSNKWQSALASNGRAIALDPKTERIHDSKTATHFRASTAVLHTNAWLALS